MAEFDVIVVGAGSGGIAAALSAARMGSSVLLVEKSDLLGGNAVHGGVHIWEPGVGGTGIPFDIYRRLKQIPGAVGIYSIGRHLLWKNDEHNRGYPGGESLIDVNLRYRDSLWRYGSKGMADDEAFCRRNWHGVVFEPDACAQTIETMLNETGRCTLRKKTAFRAVHTDGSMVTGIELDDGSHVRGGVYIDATADAHLALACGCAMMSGQESQETFGEPGAPEKSTDRVNAVTLIFRVTRVNDPGVELLPTDVPAECWWAPRFGVSSNTQYPCGDFNINMLPTMQGRECIGMSYADALRECSRRVRAYWHHLQTSFAEFRSFRIKWIAPSLGVRETRRTISEYVLTEHDLLAGFSRQTHPDIIAVADHARDVHGEANARGVCGELAEPYGVPFQCLIPKGWANVLVACRGAGFSSIAASSCRLSRTMMQLGQAAGTAAALAHHSSRLPRDVDPALLRQALREQHAQVDWPTPPDLQRHVDTD